MSFVHLNNYNASAGYVQHSLQWRHTVFTMFRCPGAWSSSTCSHGPVVVFQRHQVNYHLYADDKQAYVSVPVRDVSRARTALQHCISDISSWCPSRRLQLNATKTELIWFVMLLPVTQNPPGSSGRWTRYNTTVSVGFCTLST